MLPELRRLTADDPDQAQRLRKAAADLLGAQFLHAAEARDRASHAVIVEHYAYFAQLFDALDMRLVRDDDFGYVGLVPGSDYVLPSLKQDETLVLLLLRLLYEEAFDRMEAEGGTAWVDANALADRYHTLLRREPPRKGRFGEILTLLRRHGLIRLGDEDGYSGLPRIQILPNVRVVTSDATLKALEAFAQELDPEEPAP